ncbi:MAG: HAD family hydrolase [Spirochaetales bacterium]|nr:HAD family hydrolase [Spirochaetales bacterium]
MRKYIQNYLDKVGEKKPLSTGVLPVLPSIPGIKAVFFDIYGTLLISSSGDVDVMEIPEQNVVKAFEKTGIKFLTGEKRKAAACLNRELIHTIRRIHRERKKKGIPFPEVDIIDIWKQVLVSSEMKAFIKLPGSFNYSEFAFLFEMFNNPLSPMPGMKMVLTWLSGKRIIPGIISNAQFYTPLLLHYFLSGVFTGNYEEYLFRGDCMFFSYRYGRAKPDRFLYERAREKCRELGISPEAILYTGNDMRNDILPAKRTGFRTVLFAGDKRSLRLREDDAEASAIKPDAVITELSQLYDIIGE